MDEICKTFVLGFFFWATNQLPNHNIETYYYYLNYPVSFCLGLSAFSFCMSYFPCSVSTGWLDPGVTLSSLFVLLLSFSLSLISPPTSSLCLSSLPILLLHRYWPVSILLDQTGALGWQGKTNAANLYTINLTSLHQ